MSFRQPAFFFAAVALIALLPRLSAQESPARPRGETPPPATAPASVVSTAPARGMVISCPGFGREWGSQDMWDTLDELRGLGVNAVQIHPYVGIQNDGSLRLGRHHDAEKPPAWVTRPIKEAQTRGLRFMMKPHIAYWGSKFSWRGAITFGDDEEAWARFFRDYEIWIVAMARMSRAADCFVVGTELDLTLHREKDWRRIIKAVRAVHPGRLTYAANWSDYRRVPFWDALDEIGIQAYFPLATPPKKKGVTPQAPARPDRAQIETRWTEIRRELEVFAASRKRPVVFTELGYNCGAKVATEPWDPARGPKTWEPLQALCLEVALETIEASPTLTGCYLWKWFPGRAIPRDFNVESPHLRKVLDRCWEKRARAERARRAAVEKTTDQKASGSKKAGKTAGGSER